MALCKACFSGCWMIWLILLMGNLIGRATAANSTNKTDPNELLKKVYQKVFDDYKGSTMTSDCKVASSPSSKDHRHWGTLETLEFLSGNRPADKMTKAELRMQLNKTRKYLTRIGYLRDPGSLVFVQKQVITLKLEGCTDGSQWRKQGGGKDEDKKYQDAGYAGASLKQHTDQPWSYINKYTCFDKEKRCAHTFYVITKILPDLPADFMVREGGKTTPQEFTCGVPFCNIMDCHKSAKEMYNRRSYPPYFIYWDVPATLKPLLGIDKNQLKPPLDEEPTDLVAHPFEDTKAGVQIQWYLKRKNDKDDVTYDHPIIGNEGEWKDAFGREVPLDQRVGSAFSSSFAVSQADPLKHTGIVECVIMDGNGIVSTPNLKPGDRLYDFRGDVNVHVLPRWQLWGPVAVSVLCILLVILIICVCPRKMEHDDGTRYTKDELVVPIGGGETSMQQISSVPEPSKSMEKQSVAEVTGENRDTLD